MTDYTDYICTLSTEFQSEIRQALIRKGISGDDLERAMNSRYCDVIDILRESVS